MSHEAEPTAGPNMRKAKASNATAALFDLRSVIALLFGVYGIVLTLLGLFTNDEAALAKAGNMNLNLWTGIGMLIVAAIFVTWVVLRPPLTAAAQEDQR